MLIFCLTLPFIFLKFWFFDAPRAQFVYFISFNRAFLHLFSLPLLVKTYLKPWKNEYRQGLVGFSIAMGMFVKTFVILADIFLLMLIISIELFILLFFIFWPILTTAFLFL